MSPFTAAPSSPFFFSTDMVTVDSLRKEMEAPMIYLLDMSSRHLIAPYFNGTFTGLLSGGHYQALLFFPKLEELRREIENDIYMSRHSQEVRQLRLENIRLKRRLVS